MWVSSHLFCSLNGKDMLLKTCTSLQLLSPPEKCTELLHVPLLREMCLLQRAALTGAAACEVLGLLCTAGGSLIWEWMSWLGSTRNHPCVHLHGQVLPRLPVSIFRIWEGFSLVLNWSFLLCWNQWLVTTCSLVILYFFSISVKTYDFLLFKITSERLYNLSGFITQEFCLFSSWKSHTGKILSKCSFCECAPVLREVLYIGPFLTEALNTRIKSKSTEWIKLWRAHSQTNTGRWEYKDDGGLDLKVSDCLRLLIPNLWHLCLLFFLFLRNFCSITNQKGILYCKFNPDPLSL